MTDCVVVNAGPGETRIALLAEDRTVEVFHHRAGAEGVVGNLYLGRVSRVVPGVQAAFVDIGLADAGFLNAADAGPQSAGPAGPIGSYVHEGEAVLVRVVRDPIGDKGARLTMRPTLPGCRLVYAPGTGTITISRRIVDADERARLAGLVGGLASGDDGFVVRTAAAGADGAALVGEADELRAEWGEIERRRGAASAPACLHRDVDPVARALRDHGVRRAVIDSPTELADGRRFCARYLPELEIEPHHGDEPVFERFGVEAALDEALEPRVALPTGGELVIDETEALCAIDVDTRGSTAAAGAALRTNLEAAAEIARQLRLRAIGGLIVIDFVHMTGGDHRRRVLGALRSALADDRAAAPPEGFSRLGLVEMTRRRTRPPLAEVLGEPCAACHGRRRRKSAATLALEIARTVVREAMAMPGGRLAVVAAPEVAAALSAPDSGVLAALGETLGRAVEVRAEVSCEREAHDIVVP